MVIPDKIRIATRQSPLALWQAEFVKAALEKAHASLAVELLPMTTRGDKILDSPLAKIGGKGLFIKELEVAMLEGRADIAVHSMKDVPMEFPVGLGLAVICEREDYRDAFVSSHHETFDALPEGAVVGSSSLRRQCQLRHRRPDITIKDLRGNVNSRLAKLDAGDFDAIILASAGLIRLGMEERITERLDTHLCLPAGGQGAVGIECNTSDEELMDLLSVLSHPETTSVVLAERAMNQRLNGGCQVPIACLAEVTPEDTIRLRGLVGEPAGREILRTEITGPVWDAEALGARAGDDLIAQGADRLLSSLMGS